jgi:Family of unknown function (DUF6789)
MGATQRVKTVPARRRPSPEWLVAAMFLASGAALLVYILAGLSLRWTLLGLVSGAVAVAVLAARKLPPEVRRKLRRRIAVGAVAGAVATVCYDIVRIALVEFAGLQLRPLEAWRLFGLALAETEQSSTAVFLLGTAFHVGNGIGFGIAYTVVLGRKGIWAGIAWALVLETVMVSVYPGWLGLRALDEFLSVSATGHLVYGSVLGVLARSLLRDSRWRENDHNTAPADTGSSLAGR